MNSVAVLIPSRDRAELLERAACSVNNTATDAITLAYVDEDQRADYEWLVGTPNLKIHFGPRIGPAQSANWLAMNNPGHSAYGMIPDDTVIRTSDWDGFVRLGLERFARGIGCISCRHNFGKSVDMPFVSGSWIDAVGFYACPGTWQFFWPTAVMLLAEATQSLRHATETEFLVTHNQVRDDDTSGKFEQDAIVYARWTWREYPDVVEKLRAAIEQREPVLMGPPV